MIGGVVRHGRTARDARNLGRHLLKDSPTVEIVNSAAPDLAEAMDDMMLARDASRADSSMLHMYLSPSRDMSRDELRQAAEGVLKHFGAEDHPAALIYHDKPRRNGEGNGHVHIVIGRVGPEGGVLPSGFEKIRMETAVRIAEHDLGEAPTLGRHHGSAVKWLRKNGRDDVADRLEESFGPKPERPRSALSPDKRQGLERQGIDPGTVRETVLAAWAASDSPQAFGAAMAAEGLTVSPGEKSGVWIVRQGEQEIGALDRIVKSKRREVAARMRGFEHVTAAESPDRRTAYEGQAPSPGAVRDLEGAGANSGFDGTPREDRGRPDRADSKHPGGDPSGPAPFAPEPGRPAQQDRRRDEAQALQSLKQIRLSPAAIEAAQEIRIRPHRPVTRFEKGKALRQIEAAGTGWGRLRHMADLLRNRARLTLDAVMRYRQKQEKEQRAEAAKIAEAAAWEREKFGIAESLEREEQRTYNPGPKFGRKREPEPEYVYSGPRM
jgi:hypothetical protein